MHLIKHMVAGATVQRQPREQQRPKQTLRATAVYSRYPLTASIGMLSAVMATRAKTINEGTRKKAYEFRDVSSTRRVMQFK